jgi:transgelin
LGLQGSGAVAMSLDKDISQRLLAKYDPVMADEAQEWIESVLGQRLTGDTLEDSLQDGVILCQLLNVVKPGSTKYKVSKMPFVQVIVIDRCLT